MDVIKSHFEEKTSSIEYSGRNRANFNLENVDLIFSSSLTMAKEKCETEKVINLLPKLKIIII